MSRVMEKGRKQGCLLKVSIRVRKPLMRASQEAYNKFTDTENRTDVGRSLWGRGGVIVMSIHSLISMEFELGMVKTFLE